jgi:hypothetical protein
VKVELAEQVFERRPGLPISRTGPVVALAAGRVRQHLEGVRRLLEPLLRLLVSRVAVGVCGRRNLSVRLLDLVIRGLPTDP